MEKKEILQKGFDIALLLGQIFIIYLCYWYIQNFYQINILPDKLAKDTFKQADCFIINKKLEIKEDIIPLYRAGFLISYNAKGVKYNRWVAGNGLDQSFSTDRREQENILAKFIVGNVYLCWYSPEDPRIAILIIRHNWLSTFPLMIPFLIIIIVCYYLVKNILRFFDFLWEK